jgi:hypothetical protein
MYASWVLISSTLRQKFEQAKKGFIARVISRFQTKGTVEEVFCPYRDCPERLLWLKVVIRKNSLAGRSAEICK